MLQAKGVRVPPKFEHDIDFAIRAGEIVALAGQVGSGKEALAMMLAGRLTSPKGQITGGAVTTLPTIGYVPTDRHSSGYVGLLGVREAARARRSFEESLEALGVDHIQILHLHDPEHALDLTEVTRPGGALEELFRLKQEGLATAVGLAMGRLDIMLPLVKDWPFDVILSHNRYTLLNRSADALFDEAAARGITVFNAAPYAGGILAKGSARTPKITYQDATAETLAPVRQVEAFCAQHGFAPGAAALQFSLRDPRITSTIISVSKP